MKSVKGTETEKNLLKSFAGESQAHTKYQYFAAKAKEEGCVRTLYNRRRPIPELTSSNFMQRAFGERVAMNSPLQGTAADIMKIAMIRVDRRLRGMKSRILLQVHDELIIEAHKSELSEVKELLRENMEKSAEQGRRV